MILKVSVIAVVTAVCALSIKKENEQLSILLIIGGGICVFGCILKEIIGSFSFFGDVFTKTTAPTAWFGILLKCLGLSIIGQIGSDICEDAGYKTLSSEVIMCAKASIILISLPIFEKVLELSIQFIKG